MKFYVCKFWNGEKMEWLYPAFHTEEQAQEFRAQVAIERGISEEIVIVEDWVISMKEANDLARDRDFYLSEDKRRMASWLVSLGFFYRNGHTQIGWKGIGLISFEEGEEKYKDEEYLSEKVNVERFKEKGWFGVNPSQWEKMKRDETTMARILMMDKGVEEYTVIRYDFGRMRIYVNVVCSEEGMEELLAKHQFGIDGYYFGVARMWWSIA